MCRKLLSGLDKKCNRSYTVRQLLGHVTVGRSWSSMLACGMYLVFQEDIPVDIKIDSRFPSAISILRACVM